MEELLSVEEYIAQAGTGALLNPRIDSTFKALFTQPTEDSRAAMHAFLEAATERRIKEWHLLPNEAPIEYFDQRTVNFDISCVFDDGLAADIEMQAFRQQYNYGKRAEYQVARLESSRLQKGDNWKKAPTVYQISVLDFVYAPKDLSQAPVSRYAMRTKDGRELSNLLNIIFIELPKVVALENSLEQNTALENWAIFLKDADAPEKQDLIHQLARKEKGLMEAQKALSSISADRELWLTQYHQEIFERDLRSSLEGAWEGGKAEGKAGGKAEGKAEGKREQAIASALVLLQSGIDVALIAKSTGLSLEEIDALRGGL